MPLQKAALSEKKIFTDDVIELRFETENPFNFEAGQFVTIKIEDQTPPCFRAYSICTSPSQNGHAFATCLKVVEGGRGSNWLSALKIGDPVNFMGPSGKFTFKNPDRDAFFIATGTGVTPFNSIIGNQLTSGNKNKIHLLFGLRHIKNIFYQDFYDDLAAHYPNFSYSITLSRPENNDWHGSVGRVTQVLEKTGIDTKNTDYYICGLKDMINEITEILEKKGVPQEAIHVEKYD